MEARIVAATCKEVRIRLMHNDGVGDIINVKDWLHEGVFRQPKSPLAIQYLHDNIKQAVTIAVMHWNYNVAMSNGYVYLSDKATQLIMDQFFFLDPEKVFEKVPQFDKVRIPSIDACICTNNYKINTGKTLSRNDEELVLLFQTNKGLVISSDHIAFRDLIDSMYSHSYKG